MVDRSTNRSRGFGFITYDSESSVQEVLKFDHELSGKVVEVKRAEPRNPRAMGGDMSGGGGRVPMRNSNMRGGEGGYMGGGGYGNYGGAQSVSILSAWCASILPLVV